MRRMLVNQHKGVLVLHHNIGAEQLPQNAVVGHLFLGIVGQENGRGRNRCRWLCLLLSHRRAHRFGRLIRL